MSGTSPTLLIVLRKLGRTDGRSLLKQAVKELVARDVLRVETEEPRKRRAKGPKLLLVDGPRSAPSSRALQVALRHVEGAPSVVHGGKVARELPAVAKHLARGSARREVLAAAIQDLTAMGLVTEEERKVLGLFRRRALVRTPGGTALVEADARRRYPGQPRQSSDGPVGFVVVDGGGGWGDDGDRRDDTDAQAALAMSDAVDGSFDGSFDGAFDASFDSAFDQSFDSAFDSGFSDGGGGGGGDGGGGGGDGGGGGGGD